MARSKEAARRYREARLKRETLKSLERSASRLWRMFGWDARGLTGHPDRAWLMATVTFIHLEGVLRRAEENPAQRDCALAALRDASRILERAWEAMCRPAEAKAVLQ
jgi:hypothetical protein